MKIAVLSGKGGTGKTLVSVNLAAVSPASVYMDCDVDAPNLHLISSDGAPAKRSDYYGMKKAVIEANICQRCGCCRQNCRFEAINESNGKYEVDVYACEGCGVCEAVCSAGAVSLQPAAAGKFQTKIGVCVNKGQSIVDVDCAAGRAAREVFEKTLLLMIREGERK
jgi:MinD superfamily P-loop ATPase